MNILKVTVSDKSEMYNTQQAIIKNNKIKVVSKFFGKKVGEYTFDIKEWEKANAFYPTFNPAYNKRVLIEEKYRENFPQNYKDIYNEAFNDRIIDSQIRAIEKAFKIYCIESSKFGVD